MTENEPRDMITGEKKQSAENICRMAADLAKSSGAVAVFAVGDVFIDSSDCPGIPVFHTKTGLRDVVDRLMTISDGGRLRIEEFADRIEKDGDHGISLIRTAAAIEYGLETIKEGVVVGIVRTEDSYAVVMHDMSENEIIRLIKDCQSRIDSKVLHSILRLSLDLSVMGREGKKIGTAFIIGDEKEVLARSHQMIINPYKSQDPAEKTILKKENWESVMGLAQLDGVFVISAEGEILAAGRYLDVDAHDLPLEKGLGSRHISAASITRDTIAIAVIISESGGTIRIYVDGKEILMIDPQTSQFLYLLDGKTEES